MVGTRRPPSKLEPLPPRQGALTACETSTDPPLSEMKTMRVLSSWLSFFRLSMMVPMFVSMLCCMAQ